MGWNNVSLFFIVFVIAIAIFNIERTGKRLERKIQRIERALELVLQQMDIEMPSTLSVAVQTLARDPHQKIAAIKQYRQENGASLREAKAAIEAFIQNHHTP